MDDKQVDYGYVHNVDYTIPAQSAELSQDMALALAPEPPTIQRSETLTTEWFTPISTPRPSNDRQYEQVSVKDSGVASGSRANSAVTKKSRGRPI